MAGSTRSDVEHRVVGHLDSLINSADYTDVVGSFLGILEPSERPAIVLEYKDCLETVSRLGAQIAVTMSQLQTAAQERPDTIAYSVLMLTAIRTVVNNDIVSHSSEYTGVHLQKMHQLNQKVIVPCITAVESDVSSADLNRRRGICERLRVVVEQVLSAHSTEALASTGGTSKPKKTRKQGASTSCKNAKPTISESRSGKFYQWGAFLPEFS